MCFVEELYATIRLMQNRVIRYSMDAKKNQKGCIRGNKDKTVYCCNTGLTGAITAESKKVFKNQIYAICSLLPGFSLLIRYVYIDDFAVNFFYF